MAYTLTDLLRRWTAPTEEPRPAFASDDEAYDFCRETYEKSGGVSAELREAFQFYMKNFNDGSSEEAGPRLASDR